MSIATIGTTTRDGIFEIVDTNWDNNGTMRVTVRENVGGKCLDMPRPKMIQAMRRLAKRALAMPHLTRSSRVLSEDYHGCEYVTFAVSRLP